MEKFDREEELYEYVVLATNVPNYSNVDIMDAYTKHYDIEIQDFKVRDRGGAHPTLEEKQG